MKKIYSAPEIKVINVGANDIIATSNVGFGDGTTSSMGARGFGDYDDTDEWDILN